MKFAVLFQGQGKYSTKFVQGLYKTEPLIRDVFKIAESVLNFSLSRLLLETKNADELDTENAQILIFLMEYSSYKYFEQFLKERPTAFAGHSLGEITALTVAGGIDFEDAVKLVYNRGYFMKNYRSEREEAMIAVHGVSGEVIKTVCDKVQGNNRCAVIANYNSKNQIIVSGYKDTLEIVKNELSDANCKYLNVRGAFHSPLMKRASEKLAIYMKNINFHKLEIPVISSVTAQPYAASWSISTVLEKQLTSPVLWNGVMEYIEHNGIYLFSQVTDSRLFASLDKSLSANHRWMNLRELINDEIFEFKNLYHSQKGNPCFRVAVLSEVLTNMIAYPRIDKCTSDIMQNEEENYTQILKQYTEIYDNLNEPQKNQITYALQCLKRSLYYKELGEETIVGIVTDIIKKYGLEGMRKEFEI